MKPPLAFLGSKDCLLVGLVWVGDGLEMVWRWFGRGVHVFMQLCVIGVSSVLELRFSCVVAGLGSAGVGVHT